MRKYLNTILIVIFGSIICLLLYLYVSNGRYMKVEDGLIYDKWEHKVFDPYDMVQRDSTTIGNTTTDSTTDSVDEYYSPGGDQ